LGAFFTALGFISTALVFALQDFVASFFGYLHIRVNNLYGMGDEITVHTIHGAKYSGKVMRVGIFRTFIKIRKGDGTLNTEMLIGRNVSFPNHLVLKDAVDNSTKVNRIVWHTTMAVITFESDFEVAKESVEQVTEEFFEYMLNKKDKFLDNHPNRKNIYKPKIYIDIGDDGVRFTVWFACNIGFYREAVDWFSISLLKRFQDNDVHLAYKTVRHINEITTPPHNQNLAKLQN
jgi:small-conductance mechanosensitive channel